MVVVSPMAGHELSFQTRYTKTHQMTFKQDADVKTDPIESRVYPQQFAAFGFVLASDAAAKEFAANLKELTINRARAGVAGHL